MSGFAKVLARNKARLQEAIAGETVAQQPVTGSARSLASSAPAIARDTVMSGLVEEKNKAVAAAKMFEGANQVRAVDPRKVRHSRYANRVEEALGKSDNAFKLLLQSIIEVGSNSCPIIVRPVAGDSSADYEIAAGHRRHAAVVAVLDAIERGETDGPPPTLYAEIRQLNDQELLSIMWDENTARDDLSAWEIARTLQTMMQVLQILLNALAKRIGTRNGTVSRYLRMLELPNEVLDAIALDRRKTPVTAPDVLAAVLKSDSEGVLRRAREIIAENVTLPHPIPVAKAIKRLTAVEAEALPYSPKFDNDPTGLTISLPHLPAASVKELEALITRWLRKINKG